MDGEYGGLRVIDLTQLNQYRTPFPDGFSMTQGPASGVFLIPNPHNPYYLRVIADVKLGWEHVSVSLPHRCPTWDEMETIKRLFFRDNETVMQLHVPEKDHVNYHPFCLHLWRPLNKTIPRPPQVLVGPKT